MDSVDDLSQETNKFFNYQRSLAKQQQAKQQYQQKRVIASWLTSDLYYSPQTSNPSCITRYWLGLWLDWYLVSHSRAKWKV